MLLLCLAPSFDLTLIRTVYKTIEAAPEAGKPFTVTAEDTLVTKMYFDGYELTPVRIADKPLYFGVVSLYNSEQSLFTQMTNPTPAGFLSHPKQTVYLAPTNVKTKSLNNPSHIRIPASFIQKQEAEKDRIAQERSLIKDSITKSSLKDEFCFKTDLPIQSQKVSDFGSFRRLPNGFKYFHTGLDLRARSPRPIYSIADGKIALAQEFVVPGNAVIIDHGNSIFSKYYHLSSISVQPGEEIKKGTMIGKSGGTGRVEAPHLHWEVSWKGIPTDPLAFLETMKSVCL